MAKHRFDNHQRWAVYRASSMSAAHHEDVSVQQCDDDPPATPIELYDNEQTPGAPR